ncbi:outer membrane lipoprotein carrier protein LolA [Pelagovum sp. HNIBRBA483]|uniref:LolA family protein n=1 Tax=Pelagovum sp. HNIBRBA483 TaxID=3233341 RepID=UPI0034A54617
MWDQIFKLALRGMLLATPVLVAGFAGRAEAEQVSLAEVSRYFNEMQALEAKFTQINDDGTLSTGTLFIHRPGRMRFEYDPPEQALVIAAGGSLAVFDPGSNTGPERYPLGRTPLNIILKRDVDLTAERMVVDHSYDGTVTRVTAQDPDNPEYGSIQLVFTDAPVELRQWVITDNSGSLTTVILSETAEGARLPSRLFSIISETENWLERR